jgi:hypothetical protein
LLSFAPALAGVVQTVDGNDPSERVVVAGFAVVLAVPR